MVISSNAMVIIIAYLPRIMSIHAVEMTSGELSLLKMSLSLQHWPRLLDNRNWQVIRVSQQMLHVFKIARNLMKSSVSGLRNTVIMK